MVYDVVIVGGGAAGFFAAIEISAQNSNLRIVILEKTSQLLAKVRISGGGRCNVTHHCFEPTPLSRHYPRGQKALKQMFRAFHAADAVKWFGERGIALKAEDDGRMFPVTDSSQTVIDCFTREVSRAGTEVITGCEVTGLKPESGALTVSCRNGKKFSGKKVLVAMGGHAKQEAYQWLMESGLTIGPPIPSLFTFNDLSKEFTDLMGVSVQDAEVQIAGTKFSSRGPVLITHWGLSGPAVITLSAWAAQQLHDAHYKFTVLVNWTGDQSEDSIRETFRQKNKTEGARKIFSHPMFRIPQRLWEKLCTKAQVSESLVWAEAPAKSLNRLLEFLLRCPFEISGKTTFKEEFVTCGGVDLNELNLETMESRKVPGLYFAGEVLDIDGETGGFNFQSAWTTAFLAARHITMPGTKKPGT
jgi:predicted Rossmann fold flavoprotein